MKQNVFTKLSLIFGVVIFISVFLFARAVISISFISIIVLFFINLIINRDFSFSELKLKRYAPLLFLLLAGVVINSGYLYNYIVYGNTTPLITVFSISNPIIIVIYTFSLCYFLSQDKKSADYLLYAYLVVTAVFALFCFIKFLYSPRIDLHDIYGNFNLQGLIGFTFPFVSLCFLNLAFKSIIIKKRLLFLLFAFLVIFTDLVINTSKIGYIMELFVLVYYIFIFSKKYSFKNGVFYFKKMFLIFYILFMLLIFLFISLYKVSPLFHFKTQEFLKSFAIVYDTKNDLKKTSELLSKQETTGLRIIYYVSSLEIFKEYPSIFLGGCSFNGKNVQIADCSYELINKSETLKENPMVIKDGPLMPHNEFLNYIFKGGILASIFLLMFFIYLFYVTKGLSSEYLFSVRLLILSYLVSACTGYYLTTQYEVSIFFTLLAIFLSKIKKRDK